MLGSGVIGRLRFSRQIFVLQTTVVVLLIALVAVLVGWLLSNTLTVEYGRRALAIARAVATEPSVVASVTARQRGGALQDRVVMLTHRTDALFVVVTDRHGIRLAHPDPGNVGLPVSTDPSEALAGHEVVSVVETGTLGRSVRSKTPVIGANGAVVGEVSVGFAVGVAAEETTRLLWSIGVFAIVSVLLGLAASWLLSAWLRRSTHGVEPGELTEMLYEHEAVINGIGEGVLAVDRHGLVSVRNTEAERLLGLALRPGAPVEELPVSPRIRRALADAPVDNVLAVAGDRVVVVNSRPVRDLGTVLTLRDRTDLDALTRELDAVRSLTEGLRAQRHEYANRLHTLSGLLQLGHHAQAVEYLQALTDPSGERAAIDAPVHDPYLGALLLAKAAQAKEKGTTLRLSEDSLVTGPVRDPVSVTTVLGNVLDNALRAANLAARRPAWVEVTLLADGATLHLSVQDSGTGVSPELVAEVFREGVTTKIAPGHGLGLALARHEARARGGDLWLADPGGEQAGALFVAALPEALSTGPCSSGSDEPDGLR